MMSERRVRWVQKVLWGCHFYYTLHLRCWDTDCFDGVPSVIWQSKYTKLHLLGGLLKSLRSHLWNNTSSLVVAAHHGLVTLIIPNHIESERVDRWIKYSNCKIAAKYYHGAVSYYNKVICILNNTAKDPFRFMNTAIPKMKPLTRQTSSSRERSICSGRDLRSTLKWHEWKYLKNEQRARTHIHTHARTHTQYNWEFVIDIPTHPDKIQWLCILFL